MKTVPRISDKIKHVLRLDRAFRFVWQAGPELMLTSLVLAFLQAVLPLATLYLMKLIVDAVTAAIGTPDPSGAFRSVLLWVALAAVVALAGAGVQYLLNIIREKQSLRLADAAFDVLHEKSVSMDLAYYENPDFFDTLHQAQQEGAYRPAQIANSLIDLVINGLSLLAMVGLLVAFRWWVAVILFAAALPGLWVRLRYSHRLYDWQWQQTATQRRAHYYNWMLTGDAHAKEIRLFGLGGLFVGRFRELRRIIRQKKMEITRQRSMAEFIAQMAVTATVFVAFGVVAYQTILGLITVGSMVMYFGAFQRGLSNIQQILGGMGTLYENNLFLNHFYRFLDLETRIKPPARPVPFPAPIREGIVLRGVTFDYPHSHRSALSDVSIEINPGEVVALVGANGSGKTTLVKLLCRFYDPQKGQVTIDGIDLRRMEPKALRRQIKVIFQDYVRYNLTVKENIWLGDVQRDAEEGSVEAAARQAGAAGLVDRLKYGYDTLLGKTFDKGHDLSQGEWQSLALARTFFGDAQVIVLDEPAASLDVNTEHEIFKGFRKLLEGRTAILISHRFSTIRMADRVFVMDKGRLAESGRHAELLEAGGIYASMFAKQARHYNI